LTPRAGIIEEDYSRIIKKSLEGIDFINVGMFILSMLIKLFGLFDIASAVIIILMNYELVHSLRLTIIITGYLVLKGVAFIGDVASIIDIIIGIYVVVLFFFPVTFLTIIFAGHLVIKGVMSLL